MAHVANIVAHFKIIYRRLHSFEQNGPKYERIGYVTERVSPVKRDRRYYEN